MAADSLMQDLLFETPGNPIPANASAGLLTASDGVTLRYAVFAATGRPHRGTVILLPGRNECIEKYFETIADLQRRGLDVAMADLRGQGGSGRMIADGERGFVADFTDYVGDLQQLIADIVLPDCRAPYFILGHSTGSLVALLAAPVLVNRIRRMVLCAPLVSLTGYAIGMPAIRRLSGTLYALGMGRSYLGGGARPLRAEPFPGNKLTSDERRHRRNQEIYERHPELGIGGATVSWVRAASIACQTLADPAFLSRIHTPALIIAAGRDRVVSTPAAERLARGLRSGSLLTIDGARHEIMQEADLYREQFLAAFDAFIPGSSDGETG
jgi:lysophospholipase